MMLRAAWEHGEVWGTRRQQAGSPGSKAAVKRSAAKRCYAPLNETSGYFCSQISSALLKRAKLQAEER